jgi:hypothetical protein
VVVVADLLPAAVEDVAHDDPALALECGCLLVPIAARLMLPAGGTRGAQDLVNYSSSFAPPRYCQKVWIGPTIQVENPKRLEGVNVGDLVEITYRRALALSVQGAGKK